MKAALRPIGIASVVLLGDASNDFIVDADDLLAVLGNYGNIGPANGLLLGDADDNGVVDGDDLVAVQQYFGTFLGPSSSGAVPEPGTLAALAAAWVMIGARRSTDRRHARPRASLRRDDPGRRRSARGRRRVRGV